MWKPSNQLSPLCDYFSWSNPRPFVLDYLSNKCFRFCRILMHSRSTKRHFDFRFKGCWEVQPEAPAHLTSKWMCYNQITWHFVDLACGVHSAPTAELKEEGSDMFGKLAKWRNGLKRTNACLFPFLLPNYITINQPRKLQIFSCLHLL